MKYFITMTYYTFAIMLFIHGSFYHSDAKVIAFYLVFVYMIGYIAFDVFQRGKKDEKDS